MKKKWNCSKWKTFTFFVKDMQFCILTEPWMLFLQRMSFHSSVSERTEKYALPAIITLPLGNPRSFKHCITIFSVLPDANVRVILKWKEKTIQYYTHNVILLKPIIAAEFQWQQPLFMPVQILNDKCCAREDLCNLYK